MTRTLGPSLALALATAIAAAAGCEPPREGVEVEIRPAQDRTCQPSRVLRVDLQPLADTPIAARPPQRLDLDAEAAVQTLEPFEPGTAAVRVSAQAADGWDGGAIVRFDDARDRLVAAMLPIGRACELADPALTLREGAAATALGDGRFVLVGGDTDAFVSDEVAVVSPGEQLADLTTVELLRERTLATADWIGGARVLVAGGTAMGGPGIRDTFVVLDVDRGERVTGPLRTPRYGHASARLPDGRVLLVGGLGADGAPVGQAEVIDAEALVSAGAGSSVARHGARALVTGDGRVTVVGGLAGAPEEPVAAIERFEGGALRRVGDWEGGARASAAYAALTGDRVVQVGGQGASGEWSSDIVLLLPDDTQVVVEGAMPVIEAPRAVALPDGRLFVIGRRAGDAVRETAVVDLGGTRPAPPAPTHTRPLEIPSTALPLADGSIALANPDGVDVLRLDLGSSYDDPPAGIDPGQLAQQSLVSLDLAARWTREPPPGSARGPLFARVDGARLELPRSRFGRLELEVEATGPFEVLLLADGQPARVIAVDDAGARGGGCAVSVGQGALGAVRDGGQLTITRGGQSATCPIDEDARLGVALRLPAGSGVQRLHVVR